MSTKKRKGRITITNPKVPDLQKLEEYKKLVLELAIKIVEREQQSKSA